MNKIELYKIRRFGDMLSDTFAFTRQVFKPLFSALFYIVSPALLLMGIFFFLYLKNYFGIFSALLNVENNPNNEMESTMISLVYYMIPMWLFMLIALELLMCVTFSYVKLYAEDKEQKITTKMLWEMTKKYFWKNFVVQLLVGLAVVIAYAVCFVPTFFIAVSTDGNAVIKILLVLFMIFVFFVLLCYLMVKISFTPLFIIIEDNGIFQSIRTSFRFTEGIFWKTLGLVFILSFIFGFAMEILYLPGLMISIFATIFGFASDTHEINSFWVLLGSAVSTVGMMLGYLLYSVIYIGQSVLYFSEMESRFGINSSREIEKIGQNNE